MILIQKSAHKKATAKSTIVYRSPFTVHHGGTSSTTSSTTTTAIFQQQDALFVSTYSSSPF
jgi:hypothetical protein